MEIKYNLKDKESILDYAKKLVGKSLSSINGLVVKESHSEYGKVKGKFGQYLEKYYFGIKNNSDKEPDFKEAGIELKSTPLKKTKKGLQSKERLVLNIINYEEIIKENWEKSSFLSKNELILLVCYLYEKDKSFLEFLIKYVDLWELRKNDLEIIKQDWEKIVNKIKEGKAHELSEGDTFYLSACRKGSGKGKDFRNQPFNKIKAPQRAFSFKQKYVNSIISKLEESESLVKDKKQLEKQSFEEIVYNRFKPYLNKEVKEIEKDLGINLNANSKAYFADLARRIMGIKSRNIEEFEKADVSMKIIRLKKNGMPKEDMSFPTFNPEKIISLDWEESKFYEHLTKKFFFVVFQIDKDKTFFKKAFFWTIPHDDLQESKKVWEKTKEILKEGVRIWREGKINRNNLPNKSENKVSHVRPHGQNAKDTFLLPNGKKMTKQCFWLNASYLKEQIEKTKTP
jgi:DNA mismatch repair endonuclease MutH